MSNNKIKVAFIGGGSTIKQHIKTFSSFKNIVLSGIYNRTKNKAKKIAKEFNIKNICISIKDLYKKTNADIVIIAVSADATKKICERRTIL